MSVHSFRLLALMLTALSTPLFHAQTKAADATEVAPPPPAPAPAPPKHPAEMQPTAPKVTCKGDQLTISADNSTLQAILFEVKGCTGAHMDIPEGTSRIRSFEEIGPGPVRTVLDELLSGTQYNYVIQSSDANPARVETVVMTMRAKDADKPGEVPSDLPMTNGRRLWQHMQKFDKPDPSTLNDENSSADADAAPAAESAPPAAEKTAEASSEPASAAPAEAAAAQAPTIAPAVVDPNSEADPAKAVSDRISAMQQMFTQRQTMIQKQNQTQSGSPNN